MIMKKFRWTPSLMDRLEHAVRKGLRVAVSRRGTEFIVVAVRLTQKDGADALVGHLPMTGDELVFRLQDLDAFQVIGD